MIHIDSNYLLLSLLIGFLIINHNVSCATTTTTNLKIVSAGTPIASAGISTPPTSADNTFCVRTYGELQNSVLNASTDTNYTQIDVCNKHIMFEGYLNVTYKWIDIRCRLVSETQGTQSCIFDGQNQHGFIVGEYSHVKITSIDFINGASEVDLNDIDLKVYETIWFYNSYIIMKQCSIMNNDGIYVVASFIKSYDFDTTVSLFLEDMNIMNNKGFFETISIEGLYYSIIRSHFSNNNAGGHLAIVGSNGIIQDTIFENGISDPYTEKGNVRVDAWNPDSPMNATTLFKNTTFTQNAQSLKGTVLRIEYNVKVILDGVMFRKNYGPSKKNNNSIKMVSGNKNPTLKCIGNTKFCDNIDSSQIIVDGDFIPYTGSTNCFDKQFRKGC